MIFPANGAFRGGAGLTAVRGENASGPESISQIACVQAVEAFPNERQM